MKTIGILGGMSPEASLEYYRQFISLTKKEKPKKSNPELIIYNLNFEDFYRPLSEGRDQTVIKLLLDKLRAIERAGADFALMASNTPHMYYNDILEGISIPLLSIVEATATVAEKRGFKKVGLLGTNFTMTSDFYPETFENKGISLATPDEEDREFVNRKIFEELVKGKIKDSTRNKLKEISHKLRKSEGIEATVLGCTELPLILSEKVLGMPVLDTTRIHIREALKFARN